jgi:hypothetical protein
VTGDEHEAQEVIAHIVVKRGFEIRHSHLLSLKITPDLLVLAREPRASAEVIDSTMLGGGHKPRAWVVRDARFRPLLERGDQSILCEVFGEADIAHDPHKAGNEPG